MGNVGPVTDPPAADRPLPDVDLDALVKTAHDGYRAAHPESARADRRARRVLPGGNTRSVLDFAPFPFRVRSASGVELHTIDGHRLIDFCGNYTAGLLGHSPDLVKRAVIDALDSGWALGATHEREIELAELLCSRFASMDQVRFTNSGTEANLMAIGTALHATGRSGVGVFDRAYHGGVLSFGPDPRERPAPMNVPHRFIPAGFDDASSLDALFADDDLGCVLVEAVQGSGGCRPASPEFLHELRRRCTDDDVVLIFDEVMTSRLAPGGAQQIFGIDADMTTLGKYFGGGMTFGAFGGTAELMGHFDAEQGGTLTQAGTFNNNVVSMAAAVATLRHGLPDEKLAAVNARGEKLRTELNAVFAAADLPLWTTGLGSMLNVHAADDRLVELAFHAALADGIYIARRGFLALSMAITDAHCADLTATIERWTAALAARG